MSLLGIVHNSHGQIQTIGHGVVVMSVGIGVAHGQHVSVKAVPVDPPRSSGMQFQSSTGPASPAGPGAATATTFRAAGAGIRARSPRLGRQPGGGSSQEI